MPINLYYNVTGQSIHFDCPEGRPSSVTSVAVYDSDSGDSDTAETATTGSAAVETNPDTTLDGSAGFSEANPKLIPLTATTGVSVGRSYLLDDGFVMREWVTVESLSSGVSVSAVHPLLNDYVSGVAFLSTRISIGMLDSWMQDDNNISDDVDPNPGYRVRWEYVVDGATYVHDDYFNLVRYTAGHTVIPADVDAVSPGWMDMLPTDYRQGQGRRLLDEAYKELQFDLHRVDIPQETLRNKDVVNRLVIRKALLMKQQADLAAGSLGALEMLEEARNEYQALLQGLVSVVNRTDMSTTADGAGNSRIATTLMEK